MMQKKDCRAKAKDVIGPLPDGTGLIILEAAGKTFPISCPLPDAASCYCHLYGKQSDSPYHLLASSLASLNDIRLAKAEITEVDNALYALLFYTSPKWERPIRSSTSNPAEAINMCLASGKNGPTVSEGVVRRVIDSSEGLLLLKKELGLLWPLAPLTSTPVLKSLYDYLDYAMPGGCVLRTGNGDFGRYHEQAQSN